MSFLQTFSANAKLLLSGEYLLLKGALALAVPLKFRQLIRIQKGEDAILKWKAEDCNGVWFQSEIEMPFYRIISSSDINIAENLITLLKAAAELNHEFLNECSSKNVSCFLDWDHKWGLGSSSSLIVLVSKWAQIDAFEMHRLVSSGSGYDVFCSASASPILFSLKNDVPKVEYVNFQPPFADNLYFVYLQNKQSSSSAVKSFLNQSNTDENAIREVTEITTQMLKVQTLQEFMTLVSRHELIISETINMIPVRERLFDDFEGVVKSLGAWGGDFVMVATTLEEEKVKKYFADKGYPVIFAWNQMLRFA